MTRKPVTKLSPHLWEIIRQTLKDLKGPELEEKVAECSRLYGPDKTTIRRFLKKSKGGIYTSKRSDKGIFRFGGYPQEKIQEWIELASAMKYKYKSQDNKTLSTRQVCEALFAQGLTDEQIPFKTMDRWLKKAKLNFKAILNYESRSTTRLTGNGPNHVWVVDFSTCEMYYIGKRNRLVIDTDVIITDKNHREEKLTKKGYRKVLFGMVVDLYSGAYFAKGYVSPGESAELVFRFLCDAMQEKEDAKFIMRGRPQIIYWDRGPGNISERIKDMLFDLGIEFVCRKRKEAGGKVEARIGAYKRDIERPMMHDKPQSIDEYNAYAMQRIIKDNTLKGFFSKWSEIHKNGTLIEFTQEDIRKLGYTKQERQVSVRGTISLSKKEYYVSTDIIGEYVTIYVLTNGEMKAVDRNGHQYKLDPDVVKKQTRVFGEDIKKEKLSEYGELINRVKSKRSDLRGIKRNHFDGEKTDKIVHFDRPGIEETVEVAHQGVATRSLSEYWVRVFKETGILKTQLPPAIVSSIDTALSGSIEANGRILQEEYDITLDVIKNSLHEVSHVQKSN